MCRGAAPVNEENRLHDGAIHPEEVKMYSNYESDRKLVQIVPDERQIRHQEMEFYAFIHFSVNTFTDQEWGDGTESPELFNPTELDCNQWVEACKSAGMTGLILTVKHHDGFCLWPSEYTEHSVKNSPFRGGKGDVVRECAEACAKGGIKFGIYLSPWDRNCPYYGSGKQYDDYYCNQLTELLTDYGDIFTVWFDNACGEGEDGKVQIYDWERYFDVVRSLQPDACMSVAGKDIRWCGNEAGYTRESEWSVIAEKMKDGRMVSASEEDLGSREILSEAADIVWRPAETDTSIRPGWFFHRHENLKVRTLKEISDIYFRSVGGNTTLLLNIPPDTRGLFHQNDVKRLSQLGNLIKEAFAENLMDIAEISADKDDGVNTAENMKEDSYDTYFATPEGENTVTISIRLPENRKLHSLVIKENIKFSQRIENFTVECRYGKSWKMIATGTTVGYKKIVRFRPVISDMIRINIKDSRVNPVISFIGLY